MDTHPELDIEEILKLEFEYARETAMQAQNDRTVVVNLYLILVGGVGSILLAFASNASNLAQSPQMLVVLFFLLFAIGVLTLLKLIRLSQAWHDSALAMNRIKDYYLDRFPELADAFHWRTQTIPRRAKAWSITFILALMVALIDSVALAGAVHMTGLRNGEAQFVLDGIVWAFALVMQGMLYFICLGEPAAA